jgi:hypothetical protein
MAFQKLLNLKNEQKESLESIQRKINEQGGNVSLMALISDSIDIFIDQYGDVAIKQYSKTENKYWE